MTVYVESSVVLRVVLGQGGRLREWGRIRRPIASRLVTTECLRSLDRVRLHRRLAEDEFTERRAGLIEVLGAFEMVTLDQVILDRAAEPLATPLGTLDALHLATALRARTLLPDLLLATHDGELAEAARSLGFRVLGSPVAT